MLRDWVEDVETDSEIRRARAVPWTDDDISKDISEGYTRLGDAHFTVHAHFHGIARWPSSLGMLIEPKPHQNRLLSRLEGAFQFSQL